MDLGNGILPRETSDSFSLSAGTKERNPKRGLRLVPPSPYRSNSLRVGTGN